jgi:hypothetical protein
LALKASQQTAEVVSLLINSGADVDAESNERVTPLMLARELPVVRLLLGAGAAVDTKSVDGTTAQHKAAERGLGAAVICSLLKAGADATAANSEGHDAAAIAVKQGHTATAALLQRAAAAAAVTTLVPVTAAAVAVTAATAATVARAEAAAATSPIAAALTTAEVAGMSNDAASRAATGSSTDTTTAASANCTGGNAEAVYGNTAKPDAVTTAAAAAAADVSAAKATAMWMCTNCNHVHNPMEATTCQACGVVGNTEQEQRAYEAALPQLIARGPDITLRDSFFDDMPDETAAKAKSVALVPRSLRKTSRSRTKRGTVSSSTAAARARLTTLVSASASKAVQSLDTTDAATATATAATGTAVVPSCSELVGGSWRCAERDLSVRNRYLSKIAQVLASSTKTRPVGTTRHSSTVPAAARHLEVELYSSAASFAEYSDDSTWQMKMCGLAENDWENDVAAAWRAADPYCQQREQAAVAVTAAAGITPTPLACIYIELAGGNWRSDAHDMQQRRRTVNAIAQSFVDAAPALVLESALQLEASVYSSACSFQSYSDETTLVLRLAKQ